MGDALGKSLLLSKENIGVRLKFANQYLGKDQDVWNNALWTYEWMIRVVWPQYQKPHLAKNKDSN